MGFDLCARCHADRGACAAGRFDQSHTPDHRFEERPMVRTWLHELQGLNPTLQLHQLMDLVGGFFGVVVSRVTRRRVLSSPEASCLDERLEC